MSGNGDNPFLASPGSTLPGLELFTSARGAVSTSSVAAASNVAAGNVTGVPRHPIMHPESAASSIQAAASSQPHAAAAVPSAAPSHEPTAVGELQLEGEASLGGAALPDLSSDLPDMSVQQIMDLDVDSLSVKIDKHHCATKKAVLDHFMETKSRLLAAQLSAVEEERRRGGAVLDAKSEEIGLLQEELRQGARRMAKLTEYTQRMSVALDAEKERKRVHALKHRAFHGWGRFAFVSRRARVRMQHAERWHAVELLQRRVLRGWFRAAMQQSRVTLRNGYARDLASARDALRAEYEQRLVDGAAALAASRDALAREQDARAALEEDMKQAFMRGVCALNIEAMAVMKRGAPPGGANPAAPPVLPRAPTAGSPGPADVPPAAAPAPAPATAPAPAPAATASAAAFYQRPKVTVTRGPAPPAPEPVPRPRTGGVPHPSVVRKS